MENGRRAIKKDLTSLLSPIVSRLRLNEPLKDHCTLRIGGPARYFAEVHSREELKNLVSTAVKERLQFMVLGAGSNVLMGDKGFDGVVIRLAGDFADYAIKGAVLTAGAGARIPVLVNKCMENGLSGMEALAGIPGTVGGALVSNAGTKEGWIGNMVSSVEIMAENGNFETLKKKEIKFGYRSSNLEGRLILKAGFTLKKAQKNDILQKINGLMIHRSTTQPLDAWSVGSIFKNPESGSAGKLIEAAGLKGMQFGGAKVSEKHANFIVNAGNATAADMRNLIAAVRRRVRETSGVDLELEIKIIGE